MKLANETKEKDFNPLPPHGGRPPICGIDGGSSEISIHSLRMEGDPVLGKFALSDRHFNPLPPHGGRPRNGPGCTHAENTFQSTPSAWRETCPGDFCKRSGRYFNPLPPHGGRPLPSPFAAWEPVPFQSTPSAWRETSTHFSGRQKKKISIHSLRMEGDVFLERSKALEAHFNPLPPHGGRPIASPPS